MEPRDPLRTLLETFLVLATIAAVFALMGVGSLLLSYLSPLPTFFGASSAVMFLVSVVSFALLFWYPVASTYGWWRVECTITPQEESAPERRLRGWWDGVGEWGFAVFACGSAVDVRTTKG
jgi:hypothetical protein